MPQLFFAATTLGLNSSDAAGSVLGSGFLLFLVILAVVLFVNAVLWLFLPFVLISKLNQVIRRLKSIEGEVETMARNTKPAGSPGDKPSGDSPLSYHFGR
jgi:hypothetical protein